MKALHGVYGLGLMAGSACTFSVVTLIVSLLSTELPNIYQGAVSAPILAPFTHCGGGGL